VSARLRSIAFALNFAWLTGEANTIDEFSRAKTVAKLRSLNKEKQYGYPKRLVKGLKKYRNRSFAGASPDDV